MASRCRTGASTPLRRNRRLGRLTGARAQTDPSAAVDADAVLAWGASHRRDLPWRSTRDPWAVLVAEVMLQQTQVGRVVERWDGLRVAYPTPTVLARSSLGGLLRRWQGLGYPRRARDLHRAAVLIVERHGGAVPDDVDALVALPGIGPYTARAVLAFAFERDVAVVDTNIARILARIGGERLTPRQAQTTADSLVPAGAGWAWNQTLMDVGATTCRPQPDCPRCPLARWCAWLAAGRPDPDPARRSAGVSRPQPSFDGSRRQARGRVLRAVTRSPRPRDAFPADVVDGLLADGLLVADGDVVRLPE